MFYTFGIVIKYDYTKDIMTIGGISYSLSAFRKWLLTNHEQLCLGHFIKAIRIGDRIKFTYDWLHIYFVAGEYNFTQKFIHDITTKSPGDIPGSMPTGC